MADKKVMMNHNLAKALMEAGVQHLDIGGVVGAVGGGLQDVASAFTAKNPYQAQLAPTQTTNYAPTIGTAADQSLAGYGTAQTIQAQQQDLARALLAQSQGQGPNPAQAALNQSTGQNVAAQAALMAGARGASSNPALIARQAAMQGAATQQNAVGQAATLQAQQQIAAEGALSQQQAAMANQNIAEQGVNNQLFGAATGAQNTQNSGQIENYGNTQRINAGVAEKNAEAVNKTTGGFLGGISGAVGGPLKSFIGLAKGGKVPAHLHHVASIYHPDFMSGASDFKAGGPVPGQAEVKGNSAKNDTVPAMVSPGEVVLPRSVTQAKDAPSKAAEFMKHLQDKKGGKGDSEKGYEKVAKGKKSLKDRVDRLEKLYAGGRV